MKKIVFISPSLGFGGAEKMMSFVANTCALNDYEVTIVGCCKGEKFIKLEDSIKVFELKYDQMSNDFFQLAKTIIILRDIVRNIKPDLICSFTPFATKFAVISAIFCRIPIVSSERDNPYRRNKVKRKINGFFYNKCKFVVFQTIGAMQAYSNAVQNKARMIPNPCLINSKTNKPYNANERDHLIISAGRLSSVKKFDNLIDAFSGVVKVFPDYILRIYGEGEQMEYLKKKIGDNNLFHSVFLMGKVSNVFEQQGEPYAFVLASESEGMPNVLIEAMAMGIPCIATDSLPGGPRDLLKGGERGTLVSVNNVSSLTDAIINLINSPQEANKYSIKSLEIVEELDRRKIEKMWLKIMEDAVN